MKTNTLTASAPLRAFHGQAEIKDKYLDRVRMHRAADEIVNGRYWENGKGCAVGCTIHGSKHASYESELGIPEILARLEDRFFERLFVFDAPRAKEWPERFLSAPVIGADLTLVFPQLMLWILLDKQYGVIARAKSDKIFASVQRVGALYQRWVDGNKPAWAEWDEARREAWRCWSAAADVWRRWRGPAWNKEYNAHYVRMSDKLIELMQQAPVAA